MYFCIGNQGRNPLIQSKVQGSWNIVHSCNDNKVVFTKFETFTLISVQYSGIIKTCRNCRHAHPSSIELKSLLFFLTFHISVDTILYTMSPIELLSTCSTLLDVIAFCTIQDKSIENFIKISSLSSKL